MLLQEAARGEARLLMSAVNWGEVVTAISKRSGAQGDAILDNLAALPISVADVTASDAAEAGRFQFCYGVPYADAFAGALALKYQTEAEGVIAPTLVTADNDFRKIPLGTIQIEFLPEK